MIKTDPNLLEVLVCPLTKSTLRLDAKRQELVSLKAGLAFPIQKGIPILTVKAARKIGL